MKLLNLRVDLGLVLTVASAVIDGVDHKQNTDHKSWNDPSQKQITDRCSGRHAVHDERNTWRDDNAKSSGNSYDRSGKRQVISQITKDRNGHTSYGCNSRRSRSGDCTVEQAGHDNSAWHSSGEFTEKISEDIE